jgi:hypothetical protein
VTEGHTELNLMIEAEVKALRNDISKLSDTVLALLQHGAPVPISTPPRIHWTDSDNSASILGLPLAVAKKRAPDRTPNTPNPSVTKTSRTREGMDTDVLPSARQP